MVFCFENINILSGLLHVAAGCQVLGGGYLRDQVRGESSAPSPLGSTLSLLTSVASINKNMILI